MTRSSPIVELESIKKIMRRVGQTYGKSNKDLKIRGSLENDLKDE